MAIDLHVLVTGYTVTHYMAEIIACPEDSNSSLSATHSTYLCMEVLAYIRSKSKFIGSIISAGIDVKRHCVMYNSKRLGNQEPEYMLHS